MRFRRASGVLLHPTSLPGEYGIGDLGPEAFKFIDFLAAAGQSYWQILPLGPTGYGDSPYQSFSAFAGNMLMVSPERLVEDGVISNSFLERKPDFPAHKVDFGAVYEWKRELLANAHDGFQHITSVDLRGKFETFCQENEAWLDDYALYRAIKMSQEQKPWYEWANKFKLRDEKTVRMAREELFDEIHAEKLYQLLFFRQWTADK